MVSVRCQSFIFVRYGTDTVPESTFISGVTHARLLVKKEAKRCVISIHVVCHTFSSQGIKGTVLPRFVASFGETTHTPDPPVTLRLGADIL